MLSNSPFLKSLHVLVKVSFLLFWFPPDEFSLWPFIHLSFCLPIHQSTHRCLPSLCMRHLAAHPPVHTEILGESKSGA